MNCHGTTFVLLIGLGQWQYLISDIETGRKETPGPRSSAGTRPRGRLRHPAHLPLGGRHRHRHQGAACGIIFSARSPRHRRLLVHVSAYLLIFVKWRGGGCSSERTSSRTDEPAWLASAPPARSARGDDGAHRRRSRDRFPPFRVAEPCRTENPQMPAFRSGAAVVSYHIIPGIISSYCTLESCSISVDVSTTTRSSYIVLEVVSAVDKPFVSAKLGTAGFGTDWIIRF